MHVEQEQMHMHAALLFTPDVLAQYTIHAIHS
jgi:hypothetical protein